MNCETGFGRAPLRHAARCRPEEPTEHRSHPCTRCPWRRDADLTDFTDADMAMLRGADGRPGAEAAVDAHRVACHRDQPGTAHAWRLCAGWLAVVGPDHLGIRIAAAFGGLPHEALMPGEGGPELYDSLQELEAARDTQLAHAAGKDAVADPDGNADKGRP